MGLSGKDGGLISARKKVIKKVTPETGGDEIIDLGLVGEVTAVGPDIIVSLDKAGFIPVISPIGSGPNGETLNINADFVAASVASALKAEKLMLLTDVPGLLDKKGKLTEEEKARRGEFVRLLGEWLREFKPLLASPRLAQAGWNATG